MLRLWSASAAVARPRENRRSKSGATAPVLPHSLHGRPVRRVDAAVAARAAHLLAPRRDARAAGRAAGTQLLKRSAQGAAGIFLLVVVAPLTFWCTIRRQTARRAKHRSKAVELIWSESDVLADSTRGGFGGGGGGGGGSQHELEMYELNDAAKAARDGELDEFDYAK